MVVHPNMSFRRLGILQGLAAGLMFGISFLDLVPEAVEELGFLKANVSRSAGGGGRARAAGA